MWESWWEKRCMISEHQERIRWSSHCWWNRLSHTLIMWVLRVCRRTCWVAEPFVFGQRRDSAKTLTTLVALDLHAAIGVHSLMTTKVWELSVCFKTHLALEGLYARMNVGMLFQSRRGCKRFSALRTSVTSAKFK